MEYYSSQKGNDLSSHEETWRNEGSRNKWVAGVVVVLAAIPGLASGPQGPGLIESLTLYLDAVSPGQVL